MENVFSLSNILVLPIWLLMILLPQWRWTKKIVGSPLVSLAPALIYLVLIAPRVAEILPVVLNPKLPQVAALLGSPSGATIAWVHFLAFDLFVGRWIYLDSRERNITAWIISPVLFLTLMLGPIGFALYLLIRAFGRKSGSNQTTNNAAQSN